MTPGERAAYLDGWSDGLGPGVLRGLDRAIRICRANPRWTGREIVVLLRASQRRERKRQKSKHKEG